MAPFNPPVNPTQDPNYLRDSRGADIPNAAKPEGQATNSIMPKGVAEGDKSAQYTGQAQAYGEAASSTDYKNFGDLFSGIVSGVGLAASVTDSLLQKQIENRVYDFADTNRNSYVGALEKILGGLKAGGNPQRTNSATLIGGDGDDVMAGGSDDDEGPAGVDIDGPVNQSQAGYDQGKISHTLYKGRVDSFAQDMRAQYQGHRKFVDATISQATGVPVANAYYESLLGDINRALTVGSKDTTRAMRLLEQNIGAPGVKELYRDINAGKVANPLVAVMEVLAPAKQEENTINSMELRRKAAEGNANQLKAETGTLMTYKAEQIANNFLKSIRYSTNTMTDTGILDFFDKSGTFGAENAQKFGRHIMAQVPLLEAQLDAEFAKPGKFGGQTSLTTDVGGYEESQKIKSGALKYLKNVGEAIFNEQWGPAFSTAKMMAARMSDKRWQLSNDPKAGPWIDNLETIKNAGGPENLGILLPSAIRMNVDQAVKTWFEESAAGIIGQAGQKKTGQSYYLNDAADSANQNQIKDPKVMSSLVNTVLEKFRHVAAPESLKRNIAEAAYGDGNLNFLDKINDDTYDAQTKRWVPGKYITFRDMTAPGITQMIGELEKKAPGTQAKYDNWMRQSFASIYRKDLANLNSLQNDPSVTISWNSDKDKGEYGFQVQRSSREKYINRGPVYNLGTTDADRYVYEQADRTTKKINMGLSSMKEYSRSSGMDMEAYLMDVIMKSPTGFKFGENIEGLPAKMLNAIISSRMQEEKNKQKLESRSKELE